MILALDIGNTNVVLGCIADGKILFTERMATDSGKTELDYAISLKMVLELHLQIYCFVIAVVRLFVLDP